MAENEVNKSGRERYQERLKAKYPDREWADDEALFSQAGDDYDEYDKKLGEYQGREKELTDMFSADPRSATFLNDWRRGDDPIVALVRQFGGDFKEALDDPDKQEALAEANKEYAARVAKEKEFDQEYAKNMEQTKQTLDEVQQQEGLTDDEVNAAMEFLIGIMKDGILGKFSHESILMARKAINHDQDTQEAAHEGEVRGRNAKIEERLRRRAKGDGTPDLAGKNAGGGTGRPAPDLGALENNYGVQDIWERGGERRRPAR
ncbi:MAG: hypothetical protein LUC23_03265 [Prevotellaceae bacterium]|nr:hypothetical protein [Prevotellaceae bacterium]